MSVTPPPTYSTTHSPAPQDRLDLSSVVADVKSALSEAITAHDETKQQEEEELANRWEEEGLIKKPVNIEQPVLVNVFVSLKAFLMTCQVRCSSRVNHTELHRYHVRYG